MCFLQLFIKTFIQCKKYAEYALLAKILLQEARVLYHENGRHDTTSTYFDQIESFSCRCGPFVLQRQPSPHRLRAGDSPASQVQFAEYALVPFPKADLMSDGKLVASICAALESEAFQRIVKG